MHLKYEHNLLPFLKYRINKMLKQEYLWQKLTIFVQLTGNVTGMAWLTICYYFLKSLSHAACKIMQHSLLEVYSEFTSSPSWIFFWNLHVQFFFL